MKVTINVTQDDIDNGDREGCTCPIALAAARVLPPRTHWHVGNSHIFMGEPDGIGGSKPQIELPREARIFISRFDGGLRPEPFAFDLDVPGDLVSAS